MAKITQRKVIKQGPNTLMISLPIKWVQKNQIKKGDDLNIEEQSTSLIISRGAIQNTGKSTEIEFKEDTKDTLIRMAISNLYKKGYDTVTVKTSGDQVIPKIHKAVESLMGYEITDQQEGKLIIQDIAKELDSEFDNYLKKTFFMMFELGRVVKEDFVSGKFDINQVSQLSTNIKKFSDVCKRAIAKNDIYPEKNKHLFLIIWTLEKIASEYLNCHRYAEKKFKKIEKEIIEYLDEVSAFFRSYYDAFYNSAKFDIDALDKRKNYLYYEKAYILMEKTTQPALVMHLATIARWTFYLVPPLFWMEN